MNFPIKTRKLIDRLRIYRNKFESSLWSDNNGVIKKLPEGNRTRLNFLFATNIGGNLNVLALDLVLANALRQRGHRVLFSFCGGKLPACMYSELNKFESIAEFIEDGPKKLCNHCSKIGIEIVKRNDFETISMEYSKYEVAKNLRSTNESALAGTKRFLAIGQTQDTHEFNAVLDRYKRASVSAEDFFIKTINEYKIDTVIAHHGIYVPQGNVVSACKQTGTSVLTWVQAYRKGCYIFSKNDTYHKTLQEPFEWDLPVCASELLKTKEYLASRDSGTNDWIRFGRTNKAESDSSFLNSLPEVFDLLLTNVSWDAQVHYDSNIFTDMFEWLSDTVRWYAKNPSESLVIRIHPAEVTGAIKSQDPVSDWLKTIFPTIPDNVLVVDSLDKVSTYALMEKSRLNLIYATKTGIELAAAGKAVIVAGESWIRNKDIAYEPKSKHEYIGLLERNAIENGLPPIDQAKALRFAHYFFSKRMIEIKSIEPLKHYPYARPKLMHSWETEDPGLMQVILKLESNLSFN